MNADARSHHPRFALAPLFLLLLLWSWQAAGEESPLKIVVNPNTDTVTVGDGPIIVSVKTQEKNVSYAWKLDGPGRIQGEGSAVVYAPPERLDAPSMQAIITVTVTDSAGLRQDARVTLTLLAPSATATPAPTAAPTPTNAPAPASTGSFSLDDLEKAANAEREARARWETALNEMERARTQVEAYERQDISAALKIAAWERFLSVFADDNPHSLVDDELRRLAHEKIRRWQSSATGATPLATAASELDQWLEEADGYFVKQWFLVPPQRNAFDLYKKVLQRDPANARAASKIVEMMRLYQQWGDDNAAQRRADRADMFYDRYLTIAAYAEKHLHDQSLTKEIERVRQQLRQLAAPPQEKTPTAPPSPTATPPPLTVWSDPATGLAFVWLPGGCFQMGSPPDEAYRDLDESPTHEVCLQGFWMGKYEVTQAQWLQVMGSNPAHFVEQAAGETSLILPVEQVSWNDAQEFLKKLNAIGNAQFRLPTEAEWEYACRAGTSTPYSFGDDPNALGEYAWHSDNSNAQTHPVGERRPNNWGLHDMHGNVWEWCADGWHEIYLGAPADGGAWHSDADDTRRVLRGGAWNNLPWFLRCAARLWDRADNRNFTRGLRVVRAR